MYIYMNVYICIYTYIYMYIPRAQRRVSCNVYRASSRGQHRETQVLSFRDGQKRGSKTLFSSNLWVLSTYIIHTSIAYCTIELILNSLNLSIYVHSYICIYLCIYIYVCLSYSWQTNIRLSIWAARARAAPPLVTIISHYHHHIHIIKGSRAARRAASSGLWRCRRCQRSPATVRAAYIRSLAPRAHRKFLWPIQNSQQIIPN